MTTIEELNNKIDILTNIVLRLQETINQKQVKNNTKKQYPINTPISSPKISLETWLQKTQMEDIYINTLFENGSVNAFQKFIIDHHEKTHLPFLNENKKISICNDEEWYLYDEITIKYMIETIWKKFLNYYLNSYIETECEENIKDKKKGIVLKMRQNLYDTKKNKDILSKWLKKF